MIEILEYTSKEDVHLRLSNLNKALDELEALKNNLLRQISNLNSSGSSISKNRQKNASSVPCVSTIEDEDGNNGVLKRENCSDKGSHLHMDDSDGDDDSIACFPCPFCYMDIEVHVLCSHLQDEHCFDLKNAVCPLCAANLGKDAIGHFIVQHASSLKRRRKSQKSGFWTGTSARLGKELSSFVGSSTNGRVNMQETAPDLLSSPFLGNVSHLEPKLCNKDEFSNKSVSLNPHSKSTETSSLGCNELDSEEREQRAAFVQQLIASTIF